MKRLYLSITALALLAGFNGQAQANWITDGLKFVYGLVRNNPKLSAVLALGTAAAALYAFTSREPQHTQPLPIAIVNSEKPGHDIAGLAINDFNRGTLLTVANGTFHVPVGCTEIVMMLTKNDGRSVTTAINFNIYNKKRQTLKAINIRPSLKDVQAFTPVYQ